MCLQLPPSLGVDSTKSERRCQKINSELWRLRRVRVTRCRVQKTVFEYLSWLQGVS